MQIYNEINRHTPSSREPPVGIVTLDYLESLARVARKYRIPVIKITSGQRFALVDMKKEDVNKIWDDLGMDVGKAVELCLHCWN